RANSCWPLRANAGPPAIVPSQSAEASRFWPIGLLFPNGGCRRALPPQDTDRNNRPRRPNLGDCAFVLGNLKSSLDFPGRCLAAGSPLPPRARIQSAILGVVAAILPAKGL